MTEDHRLQQPKRHSPSRVCSAELLGSTRELVILHRGAEYRLRITGNDKLLLTK